MGKKLKPFEKLLKLVENKLPHTIPSDVKIERTYSGYNQRSSGAWSSVMVSKINSSFEVGIYKPVRDLLNCPSLCIERINSDAGWGNLSIECNCSGICKGILKEGKA